MLKPLPSTALEDADPAWEEAKTDQKFTHTYTYVYIYTYIHTPRHTHTPTQIHAQWHTHSDAGAVHKYTHSHTQEYVTDLHMRRKAGAHVCRDAYKKYTYQVPQRTQQRQQTMHASVQLHLTHLHYTYTHTLKVLKFTLGSYRYRLPATCAQDGLQGRSSNFRAGRSHSVELFVVGTF